MKMQSAVQGVLIAAVGVIVAGYIMSTMRSSVPFIDTAHDGFDS